MEKVKNIPELRFPGFEGEWEETRLGEIAEIFGGGTPDTTIPEYWNGKINWFTPTEIKSDFVYKSLRRISELGLKRSSAKRLPIGTILLTTRATIGEVAIAIEECATNQGFQSFLVKKDNNNVFLFNWLKMNKYELTKRANGSTFTEISKSEIEKISIKQPYYQEQTKIANFLSAVDDKLTQLKRKKNLLEQYKKGVMQQLFSQQLRFKQDDGSEFPEWEEKRLGEIAAKKSIKNFANRINTVFTNSANLGIVYQRDFFDKDIANQNNLLNYYIVEIDDFIYNPRISNMAPVGPISRNHLGTGVMSPLYSVFKIFHGNLDFFEIYFSTSHWHEYMKSIANYGARADRMNIKSDDFYEMPLPFPILEEQSKIANFLSAIDEKISHCRLQIEKMELWKKGLLQRMFC